jgi:hypothetical protein
MTPPNKLTLFNIFIVMTIEEIEQSYVFKIVRRALLQQYKWITDVKIDKNDFDSYKHIIFLDVYIDPNLLGEEYDWEVARWVEPGYSSSSVGMFFKRRHESYSEVTIEVNDFIDRVSNSPAIPNELRLTPPKDDFMVGDYISKL